MRSLRAWAYAVGLALSAAGGVSAETAPLPSLSPPPAPAPQHWVAHGTAHLRALNKVDAHVYELVMQVGQIVHFGTLSITLRSCLARPADEAPDSAAFLTVEDSLPGTQGFHGWMLADEPALTVLEHPVYGLLLTKCD